MLFFVQNTLFAAFKSAKKLLQKANFHTDFTAFQQKNIFNLFFF